MTFREQITAKQRENAQKPRRHYVGNDWWQMMPEDIIVFAIDEARWPHMLATWCGYEVLLGTVAPEDYGFEPAGLAAEQAAQVALIAQGACIGGFQAFAKAYAITFREAAAIYAKMTYWNVRMGAITYADETG